MDAGVLQRVREQAQDLIRTSGIILCSEEQAQFSVNDFGLGDVFKEGFSFVDILRTPRLRITVLVLLPGQTLPQHRHPPYERESGKEETLRVLHGQTRVYIEGPANNPRMILPAGKEDFYTAHHEIPLQAGGQYTVMPGGDHWFQGGPAGSVNLVFQNRVDETQNIFADPNSLGCPIKLTD